MSKIQQPNDAFINGYETGIRDAHLISLVLRQWLFRHPEMSAHDLFIKLDSELDKLKKMTIQE